MNTNDGFKWDSCLLPPTERSDFTAALLVLFTTAARTRIVASDLRAGANGFGFAHGIGGFADDVASLGRGSCGSARAGAGRSAKGGRRGVLCPFGHVAEKILKGHEAGGAAEDVMADLGLDVDHQVFEERKRLRFVFDQRIALSIGTQADARAQAVHVIEMLL